MRFWLISNTFLISSMYELLLNAKMTSRSVATDQKTKHGTFQKNDRTFLEGKINKNII